MRTGAAGVLVGFGGGAAHTTRVTLGIHAPMASAIADVAAARRDYLDESGGRYVHVIADGGVGTSGDIVKAVACGADAVMLGAALARATDAPGRGFHWGPEAHHAELPRGHRVQVGAVAPLEELLFGPSRLADGTTTSSGRCAARWPPRATSTSRSSSGSRSSSRRTSAAEAGPPRPGAVSRGTRPAAHSATPGRCRRRTGAAWRPRRAR